MMLDTVSQLHLHTPTICTCQMLSHISGVTVKAFFCFWVARTQNYLLPRFKRCITTYDSMSFLAILESLHKKLFLLSPYGGL